MTVAATASPTGPTMSRPIRWTITSPMRSPSWTRPRPARPSLSACRSGAMLACVLAALSSRTGQGRHPGRHGGGHRAQLSVHGGQSFLAQALGSYEGWDKYNRDYWLSNYPDFAEHFVRNIFSEPHSTKQIEDGVAWAGETTGAVLAKTVEARAIAAGFRCQRSDVSQDQMPGADDPWRRRPHPTPCPRAARGRADRRRTRDHPGRRPQSARPHPGQVQRPDCRFSRPQARSGQQAEAQPRRGEKPSGRSIFPRRSGSATGGATSPSRGSCAGSFPTCRSTGWRRTP